MHWRRVCSSIHMRFLQIFEYLAELHTALWHASESPVCLAQASNNNAKATAAASATALASAISKVRMPAGFVRMAGAGALSILVCFTNYITAVQKVQTTKHNKKLVRHRYQPAFAPPC